MENKTKHLYIHIPFCKHICTYCDFYRKKTDNQNEINNYVYKIIDEINKFKNICKTIYIGGGTPNYLNDFILEKLLLSLQKNIDANTEFTIECNPEFVNEKQIQILKKYNVNRISLGVQTNNETILKLLNRKHTNKIVQESIDLLKKYKIRNISCDFIYNLPLLKFKDIDDSLNFIKTNDIKHVSFYALEIKEGSIMNAKKEKLDIDKEEDQLIYIKNKLEKMGYIRYEISNWAMNKKYYSQHNLSYWNMSDWKAIGVGAYGFEENKYYFNKGTYETWDKDTEHWNKEEIYQNILIMGLRKIEGIDLTIQKNMEAYNYFKEKINNDLIVIENNFLKVKNIDLLNDVLLDII